MGIATVFKKENSLPGSQLHFPIDDRDGLTRARERHADVRRHVVGPFVVVLEVIGIFRDKFVEELFQITARGRCCVFHCDQTATRVLNKNGRRSYSHPGFVDDRLKLFRDFICALAMGANFNSVLMNAHKNLRPQK